jgi:hypothetical protein
VPAAAVTTRWIAPLAKKIRDKEKQRPDWGPAAVTKHRSKRLANKDDDVRAQCGAARITPSYLCCFAAMLGSFW